MFSNLKNNKAAGADSIAAELLKNGELNLVDALHAVIQQAWTSETAPRSWTERVLCPVYKKSDKLDCKNYRGICLLNVTYKVYAKILYDRRSALPGWVLIRQINNRPTLCTASNLRKMQ
jgi:hypothetical protein